MKIFILTLATTLAFNSQNILAQSGFAPLGAYWNYLYSDHSGRFTENWTIRVTKDTLINGYATKTLWKFYDSRHSGQLGDPPKGPGSESFGIIKYRNDSVFAGTEFLYSFSMKMGDTIQILSFPNLSAVVDTMYSVVIKWRHFKKMGVKQILRYQLLGKNNNR